MYAYQQYKVAAKRHLDVCKQMLVNIKSMKETDPSFLSELLDFYYISGYIAETMISYAYCAHNKIYGDVMESSAFKSEGFKTHNLKIKFAYAKKHGCLLDDITLISVAAADGIQHLYDNWSEKIRYEEPSDTLTRDKMDSYFIEITNIYQEILKKYPR